MMILANVPQKPRDVFACGGFGEALMERVKEFYERQKTKRFYVD